MTKPHNERNAGRKPHSEAGRQKRITLTLAPEVYEEVIKIKGKSKLIESLIMEYLKNV